MSTVFAARLTTMKVPELVPSVSGSALRPGACSTVKPGSKASRAAPSGSSMNMLRANRLCHACSVTTRTPRR